MDAIPKYLYHYTNSKYIDTIMTNGLRDYNSDKTNKGFICACESTESWKGFNDVCIRIDTDKLNKQIKITHFPKEETDEFLIWTSFISASALELLI